MTNAGAIVWEYTVSNSNAVISRSQKYSLNYFDFGVLGDVNSDGILNILDIVSLVNLILSGDYVISGDVNGDDNLNILDIVLLVGLILDS